MQIKNIHIQIKRNGDVWSSYGSTDEKTVWKRVENPMIISQFKNLVRVFRSKKYSMSAKETLFNDVMKIVDKINESSEKSVEFSDEIIETSKHVISKIINFFSEFQFEPNFRFVNTLCNKVIMKSVNDGKEYIKNYFSLTDHQYTSSIIEKMKSVEFTELMNDIKLLVCTKQINKRFKIYYGSQGTGKTTDAMKEANLCMVCHSAMLPSDLMEDFKFEDGHPNFKPSALQTAMVNGQKIVLDEINLLPFESLRFLQSILDGKTEFTYKGQTIVIKDGFQIIGTMNLTVNGCTFALPEPLVDRACELRKYQLTADTLIGALI